MPASTSILCLPNEVLAHILHLVPRSRARLRIVSRRFRQAVLTATVHLRIQPDQLQLPEHLARLLRFRSVTSLSLEGWTSPEKGLVAIGFLQFATQLRTLTLRGFGDTVLPLVGRLTALRSLKLAMAREDLEDLGHLAHLTALKELT